MQHKLSENLLHSTLKAHVHTQVQVHMSIYVVTGAARGLGVSDSRHW